MKQKDNSKKFFIIAILCSVLTGSVILTACNQENNGETVSQSSQNLQSNQNSSYDNTNSTTASSVSDNTTVTFDDNDWNISYNKNNAKKIELKNSSVNVSGNGVSVNGTVITISSAGTYIINGTLDDGQIVINADKQDIVTLVLDNATINCSSAPAIYSKKAQKTVILLAEGTTNTLSDGSDYYTVENSASADTENDNVSLPNSALFCQDDLTITGNGTLNVNGNAYNGITSKDILRISGGFINVTAKNHGITGRDNLAVIGGIINIISDGDGIRSTYSETDDSSKGHIFIENATISIISEQDGIQSAKDLTINSGTITIISGGGFDNTTQRNNISSDSVSRKTIKAGNSIFINGGTFSINSYDDSIHSNNTVEINDGTFEIFSGDDGIHADNTLFIKEGNIKIVNSYEGLEANNIDITGGIIDLKSSDDGINAAGGNDSSGFEGGRPQDRFGSASNAVLNISGGTVYINADGDGIDSNCKLNFNGGTVIINGTTSNGNGIIDHDGECLMNGGTLIGSGTYGMLEMPSENSIQNSVAVMFTSTQKSETLVYITDSDGNILTAISPLKDFNCIIFSSPLLETDKTYYVYTGGTAKGESVNGYYSKASVDGGTQYTSFKIANSVTYVNENGITSYGGNMGGFGGNIGGHGHGRDDMRNPGDMNRPYDMPADIPNPRGI